MTTQFFSLNNLKRISPDIVYYSGCLMFFAMPFGTSPFLIAGSLAFFIWLITGEFYRSRSLYLKSSRFLPVLAVVALVWIGLLWSADPSGVGKKYAGKSYYWLFGLVLAGIDFKKFKPDGLFLSYLGGLFLNALFGQLQYFKLFPEFSKWAGTGFYSGYNSLAMLLILGMLAASFYYMTNTRKGLKILFTTLVGIYFLQLILLPGRAGYLSLLVLSPLIIYAYVKSIKSHVTRILMVILFYILVLASAYAVSPVVRGRVHELIVKLKNQSSQSSEIANGAVYSGLVDRVYMWHWAGHLIRSHPVLGVGTGGYGQAVLAAGGDRAIAHPHSNILHVAVSFGVLGLMVYGWLFVMLLKSGWQNRTEAIGFFILSGTLSILIGGLVDTPIVDAGGAFLLSVTAGLCSALHQKSKKSDQGFSASRQMPA